MIILLRFNELRWQQASVQCKQCIHRTSPNSCMRQFADQSVPLLQVIAMMALQRVLPLLNHANCSNINYQFVTQTDSGSFSRFEAFSSVTIRPRSCFALSNFWRRNKISRTLGLWRAEVGGRDGEGEGGDDNTQQKTDSDTNALNVARPGEPQPSEDDDGAKGIAPNASATEMRKESPKSLSSSSSSGSVRRVLRSKPFLAETDADRQAQEVETAVAASLAFLVALILLEGLILAASGFLPEEWDQFAVNLVYPAFTPTVVVFLAIAASYGLWQYLDNANEQ